MGFVYGLDFKEDFYRLCLPRIELLKRWFAPGLDVSGFKFGKDLNAAYRVIYHSCKEKTFVEVLRSIVAMEMYGWLDLKLLGGNGQQFCAFLFIFGVLQGNAHSFDTPEEEFVRTQDTFATEILTNYSKFYNPFK